jgi:ribonuclease PH
MFEHAVTAARMRFEAAERRPTVASRVIARQSAASELIELTDFEERLIDVEVHVASAILSQTDVRAFRRLRLAD